MADTDQEPIDQTPEEQQVRERQLLDELEREAQVKALAELMRLEPMRDFLWRVLIECKVYGSTFNRNFGDMALAEGRRDVGLWLLSEICEADPEAEMLMRRKSIEIAHARARQDREQRLKKRRGS